MLSIYNPATTEKITELEADTLESIQKKFHMAKEFQKEWSQVPLAQKISCIEKFIELLKAQEEELAQILCQETGKPISQARAEIMATSPRIQYFLDHVENVMEPQKVHQQANLQETISWEALGVVANISAWNFPYFVGTNVFIPALLCGNCVLYKPSEFASLTGEAIANLLYQSGIPKTALQTIIGDAEAGKNLLAQRVDGVFFTGSYATGKRIAQTVSDRLIPLQLELGGKDPVYICSDVDLNYAVENAIDGVFYNNGQSCCSIERLYVEAPIYDRFVEAFIDGLGKIPLGDPQNEDTYFGALTREAQIAVLESQIKDAVTKGAKLLRGGKRSDRKGSFFEPTVLVDVNHQMQVMQAESFGPIIGIQKVENDAEAITLMNDTEYGLTAGVFSRSESRAHKILQSLQSGSVYWNCCDRVSPRLPWSGRKNSGIGATLSNIGIRCFLQPKAWHLKQHS